MDQEEQRRMEGPTHQRQQPGGNPAQPGPASVPVQSPRDLGRFLRPQKPGADQQGQTAPRSVPILSSLGVTDVRNAEPPVGNGWRAPLQNTPQANPVPQPPVPYDDDAYDDEDEVATPANPVRPTGAGMGRVASWANDTLDTTNDMPMPPPLKQASPPAAYPPRQATPSPAMMAAPHSHVPWEAADTWGDVSYTVHMSANTAAGLSYLFWWVSGILVYYKERHNRFVRFHAFQSMVWTTGLTLLSVASFYLTYWIVSTASAQHQPLLDIAGRLIGGLFILGIFGLWLVPMAAAWSGHFLRLPWVWRFAERFSAPPRDPFRRTP